MAAVLTWAAISVAAGIVLGKFIKYGMRGVDEDEDPR